MIYLDHAATSWPKPPEVVHAMIAAMAEGGGNPGRSGHALSLKASDIIYDCREAVARLFGASDPLRIAFTANGTEALNLAIKGTLKPGDHAVYSSMEHNAVWRPLKALEKRGVALTMVKATSEGIVPPERIAAALRANTKLVALPHASNVNGAINDIAAVGSIVRNHSAAFLVDAAQTAGAWPIDVEAMGIDLLAFPGHKGLLGPQGTGGLYIRAGLDLTPLKEGGTGSLSHLSEMPTIAPDRHESGTPNTPGLAGLKAAIEHVVTLGLDTIRNRETALVTQLRHALSDIPGVTLYGSENPERCAGIVALTASGHDPEDLASVLAGEFGIACRAGLTCAPLAHETLGTTKTGVLRLSVGASSTEQDIVAATTALRTILL
jgi:cysteine desulfurase family protein